MKEIIGQILGVLVILGCILVNQLPKRWQMLLCSAALNLLAAFNQLLVGAGFTACIASLIAVIHCPINAYKSKKGLPTRLWENILFALLYLGGWLVGFFLSSKNGTPLYLDLMILAATIAFLGTVFLPDEQDIRRCNLVNSLIYFIYDTINLNIAALAKLFSMISAIVALVRYRKKPTKTENNKG